MTPVEHQDMVKENMEKGAKKDWIWFIVAFLSMCAVTSGQLFEQIVFVPNWLIGDVPLNVEYFRGFKHIADPGIFYFPLSVLIVISHLVLLRGKSHFSDHQRRAVRTSLTAFMLVFGLTIYIITAINIPVFDQVTVPDSQLASKLELWAILNVLRIVLPAYGIYKLLTLLSLKKKFS